MVNNLDRVAPHVVASVNAAIEELGYVPNQAARSLARRRTAVVAVVIPESTERLFADPFFATVVQGVAAHLAATDYTLSLVLGSNEGDKSRRYLTGGNVDGVLVVSQHEGDLPLTRLGLTVPIVFAGRPAVDFGEHGHFVDVDNRAAAASGVSDTSSIGVGPGSPPSPGPRTWPPDGNGSRAGATRSPRPTCRTTWWRWGTSPRSPARRRWSGCSPVRCSTRCSPPTTRWPSGRSRP